MILSTIPFAGISSSTNPLLVVGSVCTYGGNPISDASVVIYDIDQDYEWDTSTNAYGQFIINIGGIAEQGDTIHIGAYLTNFIFCDLYHVLTASDVDDCLITIRFVAELAPNSGYDVKLMGHTTLFNFNDAQTDQLDTSWPTLDRADQSAGIYMGAEYCFAIQHPDQAANTYGGQNFISNHYYSASVELYLEIHQCYHQYGYPSPWGSFSNAGDNLLGNAAMCSNTGSFNGNDPTTYWDPSCGYKVDNDNLGGLYDVNSLYRYHSNLHYYLKFFVRVYYHYDIQWREQSGPPFYPFETHHIWYPPAEDNSLDYEDLFVLYNIGGYQ